VGIAPEQQAQVFEEFWTRSTDSSHVNAGTGLGLSISRRLVQVLGGSIQLESQPGAGTRFWFDIPVTKVSPDLVPDEDTALDGGSGKPAFGQGVRLSGRVLVAEDNPANQLIAQSLLQRLGLTVDAVSDGLEAVDAARSRSYDIILMDIGMPDMDGIAATRAIRAMGGAMARIPIVAVTAHVMRGERDSLLAQGFDDYLPKPIDRNALLNALQRWLKQGDKTLSQSEHVQPASEARDAGALIDRGALRQLVEEVGTENAEAVVKAFLEELESQTVVLEEAAKKADLDSIARAAHRLKGSAASFGATRLSQVVAATEQAARRGESAPVMAAMRELLELASASHTAMEGQLQDLSGSTDRND
jgi:CheY-like chemotaxis protein/HPt (histidine-containing phosphotransfer) domain-containing protein